MLEPCADTPIGADDSLERRSKCCSYADVFPWLSSNSQQPSGKWPNERGRPVSVTEELQIFRKRHFRVISWRDCHSKSGAEPPTVKCTARSAPVSSIPLLSGARRSSIAA